MKDEAAAIVREERQMPNKSNDPAEIWRTFLAEAEKNYNNMANQAMGSSEFSRLMNQAGGATFSAQKMLGEMMERQLVGMNLPSRAQLSDMGERLQAIEAQLVEIKAMLAASLGDAAAAASAGLAPRPKPPRTKRPPSASGEATGGGSPAGGNS